jgi:hypothetical protein
MTYGRFDAAKYGKSKPVGVRCTDVVYLPKSLAKDFTRTHKISPAMNDPSKLPCSMTLQQIFNTTGCEKRFLPLYAVMG